MHIKRVGLKAGTDETRKWPERRNNKTGAESDRANIDLSWYSRYIHTGNKWNIYIYMAGKAIGYVEQAGSKAHTE